jgi:hypothetical protein
MGKWDMRLSDEQINRRNKVRLMDKRGQVIPETNGNTNTSMQLMQRVS